MTSMFWTPLPPMRSGIADYSAELLGAMAAVGDVTAVAEDPDTVDAPCKVISVEDAQRHRGVPVYQMGNHLDSHEWIYRRALERPGVLVLHDTSLLGFHHELLGGVEAQAFKDEVHYAHGPVWGERHDPALLNGWPAIEVDGVKVLDSRTLSMERRLVEASRAIIVHDPYAASWLSERYPTVPVHVIPHGVNPRLGDGRRAQTRERFGWRDEHVVFGVFGGFNRTKRMLVAVLAFAHARRRWPNARLLIAGHPDYPAVAADVRAVIEHHGLTDSVHFESSPAKAEFERLIAATDVVVNLRWPTEGETSGVMARALGAGTVVVTSDLQQHRHLDPDYCWLVPLEPAAEAEVLLGHFERALADPDAARAAGSRAAEHFLRTAAWPLVAAAYRRVIADLGPAPAAAEPRPGVNVFADPRATTGLSESARRHSAALLAAGWPMTFNEFNSHAWNRSVEVPTELAELRRGKAHPIDLWLLNLNEFQLIPEHALDRYTIALWAWEFPEILDYTLAQLPRLDELWVVSSFVGEAFRTVTDMPITVIPNVVTQLDGVVPDRARFGLSEDELVVLFSFSASSSDARKNPWGVIEAFRRAFGKDERGRTVRLVMKVIDLHEFPELAEHLAQEVASVDGVLISRDLSREEMDALLASCDIYISLHRSEGFGMGMAEAMSLGKAVIATGYGGNTDFMPPGSAAVVGYDIRSIVPADHRFGAKFAGWYRPGQLWAEPDVEQAARWLRRLADDSQLRAAMGRRGAEAVRATCSAEAVGAAMVRRLAELGAAPQGRVKR